MNKKFKFTVKKKTQEFDENSIPNSVQSFLDGGAPEGGRNHALFKAACQMLHADKPQSMAEGLLISKGVSIGLTEHECRIAVASAYRQEKKEAPSNGGSAPKKHTKRFSLGNNTPFKKKEESQPSVDRVKINGWDDVLSVPLPKPIENGFIEHLKACFGKDERVAISPKEYTDPYKTETKIGQSRIFNREFWTDRIKQKGGDTKRLFSDEEGVYVCINPIKEGTDTRGDTDVAEFRHTLLEWDKDDKGNLIPKGKQLGLIMQSGLPCSIIMDSGGKSIHAWVKVDAANLEEYREKVDEIHAMFPEECKPDPQTTNPSRLARIAGFRRVSDDGETFHQQALLKVGYNLASDEDTLLQSLGIQSPISFEQIDDFDRLNDKKSVLGVRWLCKGGGALLSAPSGIGKSSLTAQLSAGWATCDGEMTFGIKSSQGKPLRSLILQAENDEGDMFEQRQDLEAAFPQLKTEDGRKVMADNIIAPQGMSRLMGAEFLEALEQLVGFYQPDIVWIDPILNFFGGNIIDQQEAGDFFYGNGLHGVMERTGVVCIVVHHTGKPKEDKGEVIASEISYQGLGSSILTNWGREVISITECRGIKRGPRTFKMHMSKRARRSEALEKDSDGFSINISHSDSGRMAWDKITEEELAFRKEKEGSTPSDDNMPGKSKGRSYRPGSGTNNVPGICEKAPF